MTPLLDVQNISKAFGAHVLFENISFSIAEGQHVGLIAKNGTGKSTLLSLLSGKESVDSGSIIFRRDIKVGFLEQQPKFDPEESVLDACFNHQGDPDRILKAKQILTQLHITDLTQPMGQLSGGQQKRIALANVLITEPDLLILDEVMAAINTGMLSVQQVAELIEHRPPQLELVMTGRNPPQQLVELSDYVSQIEKKKHPFDNGIPARDGIER